jgi:hypothetical protein
MPGSAPEPRSGRPRPLAALGLRTMANRLANFTPFFMVYGAEAVLPTDLQYGSPKVQAYQPNATEEAQKDAIDLLEESRDTAVIRSTRYQ